LVIVLARPGNKAGSNGGGGRKPGQKSLKTILQEAKAEETITKAIAAGITPLEVMLDNMRYHHNLALTAQGDDISKHRKEAGESAKDAAPYIHPKLASIEMAGKVEVKTVFTMDITGSLSEDAGI